MQQTGNMYRLYPTFAQQYLGRLQVPLDPELIKKTDGCFYLHNKITKYFHQPAQTATSCVPLGCVWKKLCSVTDWMTARMRATRSSAVSCFTRNQTFEMIKECVLLLVSHTTLAMRSCNKNVFLLCCTTHPWRMFSQWAQRWIAVQTILHTLCLCATENETAGMDRMRWTALWVSVTCMI